MLKESDDLVKFLVTFESKMVLEKHLCSVYLATFEKLGVLGKFWQVFNDKLPLARCFRGFVMPVSSIVLQRQCGARLPIHTLN